MHRVTRQTWVPACLFNLTSTLFTHSPRIKTHHGPVLHGQCGHDPSCGRGEGLVRCPHGCARPGHRPCWQRCCGSWVRLQHPLHHSGVHCRGLQQECHAGPTPRQQQRAHLLVNRRRCAVQRSLDTTRPCRWCKRHQLPLGSAVATRVPRRGCASGLLSGDVLLQSVCKRFLACNACPSHNTHARIRMLKTTTVWR